MKNDKRRNVTIESEVEIKALYTPEEFENIKTDNTDNNITVKGKYYVTSSTIFKNYMSVLYSFFFHFSLTSFPLKVVSSK